MLRPLFRLTAILALLALPLAVQAQDIDKTYESSKSAELEAVKLQLATSSAPTAVAELNEAESALRRLRAAKAPAERRAIASELESALTRLRLEANSAGMRK